MGFTPPPPLLLKKVHNALYIFLYKSAVNQNIACPVKCFSLDYNLNYANVSTTTKNEKFDLCLWECLDQFMSNIHKGYLSYI